MKRTQLIVTILTATVWMGANAQYAPQGTGQDDLEKPPKIPPIHAEDRDEAPLPPKVQDEEFEPTVTIREEPDRQIEEYRRNGQIYMVKITPKGGLPYYYVDTDGDGRLEIDESSSSRAGDPVQPVFWKIKEWK